MAATDDTVTADGTRYSAVCVAVLEVTFAKLAHRGSMDTKSVTVVSLGTIDALVAKTQEVGIALAYSASIGHPFQCHACSVITITIIGITVTTQTTRSSGVSCGTLTNTSRVARSVSSANITIDDGAIDLTLVSSVGRAACAFCDGEPKFVVGVSANTAYKAAAGICTDVADGAYELTGRSSIAEITVAFTCVGFTLVATAMPVARYAQVWDVARTDALAGGVEPEGVVAVETGAFAALSC